VLNIGRSSRRAPKAESQSAAAANFARAHSHKAISPQRRG
jgi:hypothetical protein